MRGKKPVAAATIESPATMIATRRDASPTSPTFCSKRPTARRSGELLFPSAAEKPASGTRAESASAAPAISA